MITLIKGSVRKSVIMVQLARGLNTNKVILVDFVGVPNLKIELPLVLNAKWDELNSVLDFLKFHFPNYHVFLYANVPEKELDQTLEVLMLYDDVFASLYITVQTHSEPGYIELVEIR